MSAITPALARKLLENSSDALAWSGIALLSNVVAIATGAYLYYSRPEPRIIRVTQPAAPIVPSRADTSGQFIIRSWVDLVALNVAQIAFGIAAFPVANALWLKMIGPIWTKLRRLISRNSDGTVAPRGPRSTNTIRIEQINASPPPYTP